MKSFFALVAAFSLAPFTVAQPSIGVGVTFISENPTHRTIAVPASPAPHSGSPVILTTLGDGNFSTFFVSDVAGKEGYKQIQFLQVPRVRLCLTTRAPDGTIGHDAALAECDNDDVEQHWRIPRSSRTTISNSRGECLTVPLILPHPLPLTVGTCQSPVPQEQLWTLVQ